MLVYFTQRLPSPAALAVRWMRLLGINFEL